MKNLITALFIFSAAWLLAQEEKTFRYGLQLGVHGTHTEYTGGMSEAHAKFEKREFGGGQLAVMARFDLNRRWMFNCGLSFNSYGFEYAISENYSLLNKHKKYTSIRSEFGTFEIPVMAFYKFNPNCKNSRWLIGAGFAQGFTGSAELSQSVSKVADANNINYLSSNSSVKGGAFTMFRWSVAREKLFKNGSILNVSLVVNAGLRQLANSKVDYTINSQNYSHEFKTNGNYAGLRLAYYLKPFKQFS